MASQCVTFAFFHFIMYKVGLSSFSKPYNGFTQRRWKFHRSLHLSNLDPSSCEAIPGFAGSVAAGGEFWIAPLLLGGLTLFNFVICTFTQVFQYQPSPYVISAFLLILLCITSYKNYLCPLFVPVLLIKSQSLGRNIQSENNCHYPLSPVFKMISNTL